MEVIAELVGTVASPTLTIVGKSDQIKLIKYGQSDISNDVRFDAKLSWDRETSGDISAIRADEIFLQSSTLAIYVTGIADKFNIEKNGIARLRQRRKFDLYSRGTKKLLWMLIPGYMYDSDETGSMNSINISANLEAKKLPIFNFEESVHHRYMQQLRINSGKLFIDSLNYQGIRYPQ